MSGSLEMNDYNRRIFDAVKDYEGMKLPYGIVCKKLNITEGALIKSLLHLIDTKALFYPGGPNSRVFFTGSRPTNWKTVVKRAILDALVEYLHPFDGKSLNKGHARGILGPGPENLKLNNQLAELVKIGEISEPIRGTFFVGEPPEDWLKEALKPKNAKESGIIYHRHSEDSDPHLRAKIHSPDDLRKEAEEKGLDVEALIQMHLSSEVNDNEDEKRAATSSCG